MRDRLSPDGVAQMAFQLAYYKMTGTAVASYESCSTAAFKHGRTETVRPASLESVAMCRAFGDRQAGSGARLDALRKAVERHSALVKDAAMGKGMDRHLFALRDIAERDGQAPPAIFRDTAYARINHNILSTSTLASPALMLGGFGPVVADGYGVGYSLDDHRTGVHLTAFARSTTDFMTAFGAAMKDIRAVLDAAP